jgi:hypothetical protein
VTPTYVRPVDACLARVRSLLQTLPYCPAL